MGRPRSAFSAAQIPRAAGLWTLTALGLMVAAPTPQLLAAPKEVAYPSADLFRRLQLDVFTCGRENSSSSCEAARKVADPLMDHARLSASCKDVLWTIREKAVVAPTNSFNRRELLNKAAAELMPLCRERDMVKPAAAPTETKAPAIRF
jgi:hypothetical protein